MSNLLLSLVISISGFAFGEGNEDVSVPAEPVVTARSTYQPETSGAGQSTACPQAESTGNDEFFSRLYESADRSRQQIRQRGRQ